MRIHEMAEAGQPLTGDTLTKLYLELLKTYYGDAAGVCKVDDLYGNEWSYIPHFYRNFYVYQYATSIVASTSLAEQHPPEGRGPRAEEAGDDRPRRLPQDALLAAPPSTPSTS